MMLANLGGLYSAGKSELQSLINDLFGAGQQGLLFVPQPVVLNEQRLYKLDNFTDPVTADGDPVGGGKEVSGNGNHLTQSVSADRPTYNTDGTLHWLGFDGVGDSLFTNTLPTGSNSMIFAVAANCTGGDDDLPALIARADGIGGYNFVIRLGTSGEPIFGYYPESASTGFQTRSLAQNNYGEDDVLIVHLVNGAGTLKSLRTGNEVAISDTGPLSSTSSLRLFQYFQDGSFKRDSAGKCYGGVYAMGEYSAETAAKAGNYLAKRAGITL